MPDTCLAVEGATFTKADPLRKAIAATGDVLSWDLPKKYEMAGWVRERAKAHGVPMGQAVARHLLERCGTDPKDSERLEREIEKLAVYCGDADPTVEDIDAVCSPDDEAGIFALMDAVGDRKSARAFTLLEMVYLAGEDPNRVLYMLLRHIGQLEAATRVGDEGRSSAREAARRAALDRQEAAGAVHALRPRALRHGLRRSGERRGGNARPCTRHA